jgi:hypothetical protein
VLGDTYIEEVDPEISFTCMVKTVENKSPTVTLRYLTRGTPETIIIKNDDAH